MLAGNDDWRRRKTRPDQREARTPEQMVAVVVIVALMLGAIFALTKAVGPL